MTGLLAAYHSHNDLTGMNTLTMTAIIEAVKKHGFSIVSVALLALYFYLELGDVKAEARNCSKELVEMYRNDRLEMLKVIERNTNALSQIKCN